MANVVRHDVYVRVGDTTAAERASTMATLQYLRSIHQLLQEMKVDLHINKVSPDAMRNKKVLASFKQCGIQGFPALLTLRDAPDRPRNVRHGLTEIKRVYAAGIARYRTWQRGDADDVGPRGVSSYQRSLIKASEDDEDDEKGIGDEKDTMMQRLSEAMTARNSRVERKPGSGRRPPTDVATRGDNIRAPPGGPAMPTQGRTRVQTRVADVAESPEEAQMLERITGDEDVQPVGIPFGGGGSDDGEGGHVDGADKEDSMFRAYWENHEDGDVLAGVDM